jgi:Kef-type K+ transport system membrane component KefB
VARLTISQGTLAFAIIILLVYGLAAEVAGHMAAIIGTFIAGLMFARTPEKELIEPGIAALAYGLFVPIFFINIGLTVNIRELSVNAIWLVLALTVVALAGKMAGAALGARVGGFKWQEAWRLGAGMASRGEVTLIIAAAGIRSGLIGEQVLSALVAVVLLTILITPPVLRAFFRTKGEKV